MQCAREHGLRGYTLIELLVAVALGCVVMAVVVSAFILQRKALDMQEQTTEMVQAARAAMDMIGREVRMAGYDPQGVEFHGIPYDPTRLQIRADLRGANTGDPPDGDTNDPNEDITYAFYDGSRQIKRKTGDGHFQPFAENIEDFSFVYLDGAGNSTTATADIRQVGITITARTTKRDPKYAPNGGYRTFTLTSLITPINLAF